VTERHGKDVVVDNDVMCLYDQPKSPSISRLFMWIKKKGALTVNRKLIQEYGGSGNQFVFVLLNELGRDGRLNMIEKQALKSFTHDRHFNYTCNGPDRMHARTVFLSCRKCCISFDKRLRSDINSFRKIDGLQPCACNNPKSCCLS